MAVLGAVDKVLKVNFEFAASGAPSVFCSAGTVGAGMGEAGVAACVDLVGAPPFIWFIMRRKSSAESVFLIAMPESAPAAAS